MSVNKLSLLLLIDLLPVYMQVPTTGPELEEERFPSQHNHFFLSSRVRSRQPFTISKEIIIENTSTQSKHARKRVISKMQKSNFICESVGGTNEERRKKDVVINAQNALSPGYLIKPAPLGGRVLFCP